MNLLQTPEPPSSLPPSFTIPTAPNFQHEDSSRLIQSPSSLVHRPDGQWHVCLSSTMGPRRWLRLSIGGVDGATYQFWSSRLYLFAWVPAHDALSASVCSRRASVSDVTAALSLTESALPPPSSVSLPTSRRDFIWAKSRATQFQRAPSRTR